jgi:hypothetical protein
VRGTSRLRSARRSRRRREYINNYHFYFASRFERYGRKSQLAIQYSYNVLEASPQMWVFWVHASTRARFEEACRGIADRLELPRRNDPKINIRQLVSNWRSNEANGWWTMVLDNVTVLSCCSKRQPMQDKLSGTISALPAAYLPQSRSGSIQTTSQSKDAAAGLREATGTSERFTRWMEAGLGNSFGTS